MKTPHAKLLLCGAGALLLWACMPPKNTPTRTPESRPGQKHVASSGAHAASPQPFPAAQNLCAFSHGDFKSKMTKISLPTSPPTPIGPYYDTKSGLVYVFPPNGPAFSSASNCNFFEWAAQMFLWTTSTVSDVAAVPSSLSPPSTGTPYVFNSEFFYRYSDGVLYPQNADGSQGSGPPGFKLRSTKALHPAARPDGVAQAGGNGVLLSQSASSASEASSLVYYGVHASRVMGYVAATNLAATKSSAKYSEFPTDATSVCKAIKYGMKNGYARNQGVPKLLFGIFCPQSPPGSAQAATAGSSAITIPDLEPAVDYLALTVELKTSWVSAASLQDKGQYILQMANVPTYTPEKKADGSVYWKETGEASKELALVGMHVVGTVKGHPEMIWGTIEHLNNAPDAVYHYLDQDGSSKTHSPSYGAHGQDSPWVFSDGTDASINTETASLCEDLDGGICPQPGEAIGPTNVVRKNPWGVDSSAEGSETISTQLLSLNANVFGALKSFNSTNGITGDPRENYFVSGANWGTGGAVPTSPTGGVSGSVLLANSTMETFEQDKGCFGCHYAGPETGVPTNMTTSHIFGGIKAVVKASQ